MKYLVKWKKNFEKQSKRQLLFRLRSMSERQLLDCGFSPELLKRGVEAWPWQVLPENVAPLRFNRAINLSAHSKKANPSDVAAVEKDPLQKDAA